MSKYIIAIEPGSSKIRGALGVVDERGTLSVKAVEEIPLVDAVRFGQVRNVQAVYTAVSRILDKLGQIIPDRRICSAYVSLGGRSTGVTTLKVTRRMVDDTVITAEQLHDMGHEARQTLLPDREVVAVTPRRFIVDGVEVEKPVGVYGRQIDTTFNLINVKSPLLRTLTHVMDSMLRLDVTNRFIMRHPAQASIVLPPEERRLGCMLVDFGAETTTVSIYRNGVLVYLATLPMGSRNITRDIMSLNHLEETAEELKRKFGDASIPARGAEKQQTDQRAVEINTLVAARAGEIIANILNQVKLAGLTLESLPGGIVVIGGGSRLRGFVKRLQEEAGGVTVRMGNIPHDIHISDNLIRPDDNIDVIATLNYAARHQPEDCTATIQQTTILEDIPEEEPIEEPEPIELEPQEPSEKKAEKVPTVGFFQKIKDKMANLLNEPDEEDDLRDDE